ncbi:ATP-binding protein [Thalassotalea euphylliae]|uniref:ATP-binding protein n=1 Tax=Thalassotalea euphylliae TaxID=1655234 RepID=UPI003639140A
MIEYVNARESQQLKPLIDDLAELYQEDNSWYALEDNHRYFKRILRETLQGSDFALPIREPRMRRPPEGRERDQNKARAEGRPPRPFGGVRPGPARGPDSEMSPNPNNKPVSYVVVTKDKEYVVGRRTDNQEMRYNPIRVGDEVVGYLGVSKRIELTRGYELTFIEQQQQFLWLVGAVLLLLAGLIALPIARHLLNPVKHLTLGMHALTQGDYEQKLPTTRKDELGHLARNFNELANTLKENNHARQRWLANIAHELRTPVAILKGELEAMLDGIRPFDANNADSLHQEISHLQKLIEDLHALTSADIGGMNYRKAHLDLTELFAGLESKYGNYLAKHNMRFSVAICDQALPVYGDETRLNQLIENLLGNAAKYAGDGTRVNITITKEHGAAKIMVEDSGHGVAPEHLPLLFEHLYRVDSARTNVKQGTGLGLSICAHIVEAHEGTIEAAQASLGGLAVIIRIPLLK